ncbi:hypothetical protein [Pseudomonas sp. LRF_L74]|uniref:hypothetical protein n=1 Tax=Pseudomonas sp. LRF_L74 TaxID=3369422 RepID=UPI003F63CAF2
MQDMEHLLSAFWEPFSFFSLFGYIAAGILLGGLLGLLLAWQLQRLGWLGRRLRLHHWLLKLYFLLLPLAGGFLGFQGGTLYGTQQQINRHLDVYQPLVQVLADDVWSDFRAYLSSAEAEQAMRGSTLQEVLGQLVLAYLRKEGEQSAELREDASLPQRLALDMIERFRASALSAAVAEAVADKAAEYSHMDREVIGGVMEARIEQLFQADYLLGLLKKQVGSVFKPLYIALLLQAALVLLLIGVELLLARVMRLTQPKFLVPLA